VSYRPGDFKRCCDVCGFDFPASRTQKRWDGLWVCREDFEERHPQDFVRGRADRQRVPSPRPEPADTFIAGPDVLYWSDSEQVITGDDDYVTTAS
jgi:hypothetical protein